MQQILSSDVVLVVFSLLLGGLVGSFWERMRNDRRNGSGPNDTNRREKL